MSTYRTKKEIPDYLQIELVKWLQTASSEVSEVEHCNYWWEGGGRENVEGKGKEVDSFGRLFVVNVVKSYSNFFTKNKATDHTLVETNLGLHSGREYEPKTYLTET